MVKQATPKPFEITEPDAAEAIEPRTVFGKWWQKVRDSVEQAKERFNGLLEQFGERVATRTNKKQSSKPQYQPTPEEKKKIEMITALIEKANAERDGEPIIGKQRLLDENKDIITEPTRTDRLSTAQSIAQKLVTYSLNENHPIGGNKARVFKSALGITLDNPNELLEILVFDIDKATKDERTGKGQKYTILFEKMSISGKIVKVRTAWILNHDGILRLVTAYVD